MSNKSEATDKGSANPEVLKESNKQKMLNVSKMKRKGHRSRAIVLMTELRELIKSDDPNLTQIENKLEALQTQREKLFSLNDQIVPDLPISEIESDVIENEERDENILTTLEEARKILKLKEIRIQVNDKRANEEVISNPGSHQTSKSEDDVGIVQNENINGKSINSKCHLDKPTRKLDIIKSSTEKTMNDLQELLKGEDVSPSKIKAIRIELTNNQLLISSLTEELLNTVSDGDYQKLFENNKLFQRKINEQLDLANSFIEIDRKSVEGASVCSSKNRNATGYKLAKFEIPTFDGTITEFLNWRCQFYTAVHNPSGLSITEKHQYLRAALKGNALKHVVGLPQTDEYYQEALDILEENYNDKVKILENHLDQLFSLKAPSYEYQSLLDFSANFDTDLRSLQAHDIGRSSSKSGNFIIGHVISKLLPKEVKEEVHKEKKNQNWTIDLVRKALRESIKYLRSETSDIKGGNEMKRSKERNDRLEYITKDKQKEKNYSTMNVTTNKRQNSYVPPSRPCLFCDGEHYDANCSTYTTYQARMDRIRELKLCMNCMRSDHYANDCEGVYRQCRFCRSLSHIAAVCKQNPFLSKETARNENKVSNEQSYTTATAFSVRTSDSKALSSVALPIAELKLKHQNRTYKVKSLIDIGSQVSICSETLVNRLNIRSQREIELQINGINTKGNTQKYKMTSLKIETEADSIEIEVIIMKHLPKVINVPNLAEVTRMLKQKGIQLANPNQTSDEITNIEILIGSDFYPLFEPRMRQEDGINLMDSNIGNMIWGPINGSSNAVAAATNVVSIFSVNVGDTSSEKTENIKLDLERFWSLSHIGINSSDLTAVEKDVENNFDNTLCFENGHYTVRLPWKSSQSNLPDNYCTAKKIMYSTLNKLRKDPCKLSQYNQVFQEQEELGFIEEIKPHDQLHPEARTHYLPHHAVFKDSPTSPIRIVFNSSSGRPSLNDNLWPGPSLLTNLTSLLLKFRTKRWATASDIAKAFHNVALHPGDQDSTRFLWVQDPSNPYSKIKTYRFKVVVFGINASPYLLNACLRHHLNNESSPLAKKMLNNLYVDDLLGTFDTCQEVTEYYYTANQIMENAGFQLRKWSSNEPTANKLFKQENKGTDHETEKILGLQWDTESDTIFYAHKNLNREADTKRNILKSVASIWDPQGILNPILIRGKMLLQRLWKADLKWDDSLKFYQPELKKEWESVCDLLQSSLSLKIPRQLIFQREIELHAFSDASGKAYGTAVYVVDSTHSYLLISKARVAPIRELSIPKLELTAALLSARLLTFIKESLGSEIKILDMYCWIDSQVTLQWIKSKKQLPAYNQNRVEEIRKLIPEAKFKYVPSDQNSSDYVSRGTNIKQLKSDLWLNGPSFLCDKNQWPVWSEQLETNITVANNEISEPILVSTAVSSLEERKIVDLFQIEKYSSLKKLYRVTQLVMRFVTNLRRGKTSRRKSRKIKNGYTHDFDIEERDNCEKYWFFVIQRMSFPIEICENKRKFLPSSPYHQFNIFHNPDSKLLHCNRRLGNALVRNEEKFPILLPYEHPYVKLLIQHLHKMNSHVGVTQLVCLLRSKFFFMRMRQMCRNIVRKCILCKRLNGVRYPSPPSSLLPSDRVNECVPFSVIGVDYTGYFRVRDGPNISKVYIALFSCTVTRAVHLEIVNDNSVENFLQAFRRFVARRGLPTTIYSDRGSYFVAASEYLKEIHKLESVKEFLDQHRIKWKFNPARASFFGGHFERLIGVVKSSLKRTLTTTMVSREEFHTVLTETESIVNSRPLTYVSDQFEDDNPLCPQDLLTGYRLKRLPVPTECLSKDEDYLPIQRKDMKRRYKKVLNLIGHFWKRWKTEYLLHLKQTNTSSGQLKIQLGDVVLVESDGPRLKWKLGLVTKLNTGLDGFTRSVVLRTGTGEITRATVHLYPLELNCNLSLEREEDKEEPCLLRPSRKAKELARKRIKEIVSI